jgi:hypothetical protein
LNTRAPDARQAESKNLTGNSNLRRSIAQGPLYTIFGEDKYKKSINQF